jgi:hypothetical protein
MSRACRLQEVNLLSGKKEKQIKHKIERMKKNKNNKNAAPIKMF